MANQKISQMAELQSVTGEEYVPVVTNGANYKVKAEKLKGQKGEPGEQGEPGKTPVITAGEVDTLDPGEPATASLTADGTDEQGNPKYKLNLGIPQGEKGDGGETARYCLASWTEGELDPDMAGRVGDPAFLSEWHPFLIDHTDNAGETTTPAGQLKRNNYLRYEDGTFAPTVGITQEQKAACDVELYLDSGGEQKYCDAGQFDPESFYGQYGMAQQLYTAEGTEVAHIVRPWETTETKYSIQIGRKDTVYLADQMRGKSGTEWRGISSVPSPHDGIDASLYPLPPTALSPCPVCTVGGKTRSFFYLYEGETNCKSSNGQSNLCTMFSNGRTYPRVNDMQQVNNMNYARANNADTENPYPFAEGGYHALNAFITCMEVLFGTKYLHKDTLFGSGISSNDTCNDEETWKMHGGVRYKKSAESAWKYASWSTQGDIYYSATQQRTNFNVLLSLEYPKQQCMEAQMAASYAVETGVAEGEEFTFYGGTYWYQNPTGVLGLSDGEMNARVYKRMAQTFTAYDADGVETSWDVEVVLRMSLVEGMNLSGDIFAYWGGGYEQVGTVKYLQETQRTGNPVSLYLQPDQKQWARETDFSKTNLGTFDFESSYLKLRDTENIGDGYATRRSPYAPWKTEKGGGIGQGECMYAYDNNYWGNVIDSRIRIAVRLRGNARHGHCSARFMYATYAASTTNRISAGSAQSLIGEAPPQAE